MKNSVCPKAKVIRRPNFSESRIYPNIYRMFRSVDWTHDMIIVKWHLFIWHEHKLSLWQMRHRFNPRKRANDYQRYSMLTVLPLSFMSRTLGNLSSLQAAGDDHSCRYYNPLSAKKDIWKNFFSIWWWQNNVIVKTCLNQKIIKISNLIQAMKSSVCPKAKVMRMPIFSESRICPNIYRMFRSVDWTHDIW